ncbi:MAG: hypothetical protein P4L53_25255 [Candidatus Obscuribacterales bacterium]|nr:hypothetical protein [Candidatus Obscuribacterales bacterium]
MLHQRFKILLVLYCLLFLGFLQAQAEGSKLEQFSRQYLAQHNIATVLNEAGLNGPTIGSRNFVLQGVPHETLGEGYVIITDHQEPAYLDPLGELKKYHNGTLIQIPDLSRLDSDPAVAKILLQKLVAAQPRYVAIAPRTQSFRENVLLSLWSVFSRLDKSGQIAVFPGWLIAPDAISFKQLIDRSLQFKPLSGPSLHPMIIAQVPGPRAGGTRAVAKASLLQKYLGQIGCPTDALILKTNAAVRAGIETPVFDAQKAVLNVGSTFLQDFPDTPKSQLSAANLLLLFGHGIPGMTCSIDVGAFKNVPFNNKIVLCGSCFCTSPVHSDFDSTPEQVYDAPGANSARQTGEQFAGRAIANGAALFYGQMDTNGGFPELYVVLSNLLQGRCAGDSYQRLLNNRIVASGLQPEEFVLRNAGDNQAKNRRTELLYVLIGDPALCPINIEDSSLRNTR